MNQTPRSGHPCDRREALAPWKPDHLYIGDDGVVLCGRCMGVESTYTPWAWSDLGPMGPDRTLRYPGHPMDLRCETNRYVRR
jgi:hypothetical protein